MTAAERRAELESIAAEVRNCTRCPLHAQRTTAVPGEGHADTEVVFVGEGPGYNEDREGRPFVGAAGNLLNELIGAIGWRREDVFITNVVKCRPPANRDPAPDEIAACAPFLRRQLAVLDPAVVVTLGRHSLQTFMPGERIGGAHGTFRPVDPQTGAANALAYAMYHPAAALRQNSLRETMLLDMAGLPETLLKARESRAQAVQPQPTDNTGVQATDEVARQPTDNSLGQPTDNPAGQPTEPPVQPTDQPVGDLQPVAAGAGDPDDQMELF